MRLGSSFVVAAVAFGALTGVTRTFAEQPAAANYVYEIWYDVERDMGRGFDQYFAKLKDARSKIPGTHERWVDAQPNRRIVSIRAARLADYRSDRYNEAGLRNAMGDEAYAELSKMYADAQISRKSYIREYRADLSFNRHHYARAGIWATEYALVTIEPGKEKQFERNWRIVLGAYSKVSPEIILAVAKTLVGGGPQYVVTRPLRTSADLESVPVPTRAVELALGAEETQKFLKQWKAAVNKWERIVYERTDLDAGPVPARAHVAK